MEEEKLFYYQVNVPYPVGVRLHPKDNGGIVLTNKVPYVAIDKKGLRDFKRTNFNAIDNGLIIEVDEPLDVNSISPNSLNDADAAEAVKNTFVLKKVLASVTSPIPVRKLLNQAQKQERPSKTIKLIEKRLEELDDTEEIMSPAEMQGVE